MKKKISEERKEHLKLLNVVSNDENAIWLIDYWCGKDIRGLIQMPFSRHWIMHIEASLRIKNKIHSSANFLFVGRTNKSSKIRTHRRRADELVR